MIEKRFKMGESDIQGEMMFIDTETNKIYWQEYFDEIVDLVNEQQGIISALKEEIRAYPINEQYAEEIIQQNQKLRIERNDLRRENEQLKKYCILLKNQIKKMGEIGGFNKHLIKTIWESNYND